MSLLGNVGGMEGEEVCGGEGLVLDGGEEGGEVGGGEGWQDAAEVRHGCQAGVGQGGQGGGSYRHLMALMSLGATWRLM